MRNATAATGAPNVQRSRCDNVRARLTLYLLKDLDEKTMRVMAAHLDECAGCRAFAQELEPTLDLLRDALAAGQSEAAPRLSAERRQSVAAAWRTAAAHGRKRKPMLLRFHIMEVAAAVFACLFLWGLLLPSVAPRREVSPAMEVRIIEPEAMEFLDAQGGVDVAYWSAGKPAFRTVDGTDTMLPTAREDAVKRERPAPPQQVAASDVAWADDTFENVSGVGGGLSRVPVERSLRRLDTDARRRDESRRVESLSGADPDALPLPRAAPRPLESVVPPTGRPVSEPTPQPPSAPPPPASEAPHVDVEPATAAFDSVAMQRSPITMRGLYGSRSPGVAVAGRARSGEGLIDADTDGYGLSLVGRDRRDTPDGDDLPVTIVNVVRGSAQDHAIAEEDTERVHEPALRESTPDLLLGRIGGGAEALLGSPADPVESSLVLADERVEDPGAPRFEPAGYNPFVKSAEYAFSTFSIDVDTASYTLARNFMLRGFLPPPEAVRTEEFVNFFDYAYDAPVHDTFRIYTEMAPSRFGHGLQMLKIGIKGRRLGREEQRAASLTILVDSSGSMDQPDRMGLVRHSLAMLLDALDETDQVAVIQFDSRARLLLSHTPVAERDKILQAIESIQCGGATNLEAGLRLAFEQAARNFVSRGENRILLMSDGVVNLGETVAESLFAQLEGFRRQGLYLSVFGFGMGTYDDAMLKTLASKGNGAYAFIDSEHEARRVFVDDLGATLNTIAEDVKIQVEFNPRQVTRYRQLGYELRQLKQEQFRDDTVDAGEVGSGQSVTALYELDMSQAVEALQEGVRRRVAGEGDEHWLAVVRVRYRRVDSGQIEEIERRVYARDMAPSFDEAGVRFRLAACVAAFAEVLRGSPYVEITEFAELAQVLRPVALELSLDERIRELARLVEAAGGLSRE